MARKKETNDGQGNDSGQTRQGTCVYQKRTGRWFRHMKRSGCTAVDLCSPGCSGPGSVAAWLRLEGNGCMVGRAGVWSGMDHNRQSCVAAAEAGVRHEMNGDAVEMSMKSGVAPSRTNDRRGI